MKTFTWRVGKTEFQMVFDTQFVSDMNLLVYANSGRVPEPEVVNFMLRAIKPGDTVIDGGASIGFFTLLMSCLVGPEGKVHAFEPHPETVKRLRANVALNGMTNVIVHEKALSDECSMANFWHHPADDGQSSLVRPSELQVNSVIGPVQTATIDSLHLELKLIKLDIEGSELAALKGAHATLNAYCPSYIICELNSSLSDIQTLRAQFSNFWYAMFVLPADGSMPVFVPAKAELILNRMNTNVLFMPLSRFSDLYPLVEIR